MAQSVKQSLSRLFFQAFRSPLHLSEVRADHPGFIPACNRRQQLLPGLLPELLLTGLLRRLLPKAVLLLPLSVLFFGLGGCHLDLLAQDWPFKVTDEVPAPSARLPGPDKSYAEVAASLPEALQQLLASLEDYVFSLGDDVQRKELRLYVAFKRLKNFATVVLQRNRLLLYLHLDPAPAVATLANARDVSTIGHWGTGDLEVALSSLTDLDAVKPLIASAYEGRLAKAAQA